MAINGLSHLAALVMVLVGKLAGLGPLPDQCPFKFRRGAQHVQKESRRRILQVGIKALRYGDKPDTVVLQGFGVVQAVHQGPPEAVQLPDQEAIEFPCPGIGHQAVQSWPTGFGATHDVLVRFRDLPPLAKRVLLQIPELKLGVLICRGYSGVDRHCASRKPRMRQNLRRRKLIAARRHAASRL
jgi:hypothetical protein